MKERFPENSFEATLWSKNEYSDPLNFAFFSFLQVTMLEPFSGKVRQCFETLICWEPFRKYFSAFL